MRDNHDSYPSYFFDWDHFLQSGGNPGFYESEEFLEIIEIYINENKLKSARETLKYALSSHSDDPEMLYEIFLLLNDYELWNDLLDLTIQYEEEGEVWGDGHRLAALLHLGMEEESFLFFGKAKIKHKDNAEYIIVIYQAMGEALMEVDLFESAIDVLKEGINVCGEHVDFYWILLQCYLSTGNNDKASEYAQLIQTLSPLDGESWYRLGVFYSGIKDYENTIEALENAHSLEYDPVKSLVLLMSAYELNGNYNKVLQKAEEYLNLYPDSYLTHITAANACRNIENWEAALYYISQAIRLRPKMDSLYLFQSTVFLELGEVFKAIESLKKGLEATGDPTGNLQKELDRIRTQ